MIDKIQISCEWAHMVENWQFTVTKTRLGEIKLGWEVKPCGLGYFSILFRFGLIKNIIIARDSSES